MDHLDRLILNFIQDGFPVDKKPYKSIALSLNRAHGLALTEQEVWRRVVTLRQKGFIRRLGAVIDAKKIGYRSILCAAKVPADKIAEFGALVNESPQVTHNYVRSDDFNVWFTFSSHQANGQQEFIRHLKDQTGLSEIYEMEALKLFKIRAVFKFEEPDSGA